MKPTKILLVLILTLMTQSFARGEELKTVWKYTSHDDIMDAGVFGERIAVITKKEIIFLNKEGAPNGVEAGATEAIYPLGENQFAAISDDGSVIAVITHRPQIKEIIEKTELFSFSSLSSCGLSLCPPLRPPRQAFGETGREASKAEGLTAGFTPLCAIKESGPPYLSPDGKWLAIADKAQNKITFYDSAGKLLEKHTFADIKNLSFAFSKDSGYCAVNIPNIQEGQTSGFIVLFDKEGKQLWKFEHPGSTIGSLAVSENTDGIIFSSENELISINRKGKQNWMQSIVAGGISIAISQNGKYLVLCRREDNSITLYNADEGAVIWKKKLGGLLEYNSPFTSQEVLNDGEVITTIAKSWSVKNDKSFLYIIKGAPPSTASGAPNRGGAGAQITSREYEAPWIKTFVIADEASIILYSKSWAGEYKYLK